jgi:hypothetical protein
MMCPQLGPLNVRTRLPASIRLPQRAVSIAVVLAIWLPVAVLVASFAWPARSSFGVAGSSRTAIVVSLAFGLWVTAGALIIWSKMRWRHVASQLGQGALLCARCGYDLAHGASAACPECGTVYEANGLRAYWLNVLARQEQRVASARRDLSQIGLVGTVLALIMLLSAIRTGTWLNEIPIRLVMLFIICAPLAHLVYGWRSNRQRDATPSL